MCDIDSILKVEDSSLLQSLLGIFLSDNPFFHIDEIVFHPAHERDQLRLSQEQQQLRSILRENTRQSLEEFKIYSKNIARMVEKCLVSMGIEKQGAGSADIVGKYVGEILGKGLKLQPILSLRNIVDKGPKIGGNSFVYQIETNQPSEYWTRTKVTPMLDNLLVSSMENEKIFLPEIPVPFLCITVPRVMGKFKSFPFVYPNPRLDLNPVLPLGARSMVHSANSMFLVGIICEKDLHHTVFIRHINMDGSSKWIYYDPTGSQVIEVVGLASLFDAYQQQNRLPMQMKMQMQQPQSPANVSQPTKSAFNYILQNGHVYFYSSPGANQNQLAVLDSIAEKLGIEKEILRSPKSPVQNFGANSQFPVFSTEIAYGSKYEYNHGNAGNLSLLDLDDEPTSYTDFDNGLRNMQSSTSFSTINLDDSQSIRSSSPLVSNTPSQTTKMRYFDVIQQIPVSAENQREYQYDHTELSQWLEATQLDGPKFSKSPEVPKSPTPPPPSPSLSASLSVVPGDSTPDFDLHPEAKLEHWLDIVMMAVFAETAVFYSRLLRTVCTVQPHNYHGLELRKFLNNYVDRQSFSPYEAPNFSSLATLRRKMGEADPTFSYVKDLRGVLTSLFAKCLHLKGFLEYTTGNDDYLYLHALNMDRLRFNPHLCTPIKLLLQQSLDSQELLFKRFPEPALIVEIRQTSPDVSIGVIPNMNVVVKCRGGSTFSLDLHAIICRSRHDSREYSVLVRHRHSSNWLHKEGPSGKIHLIQDFSTMLRDHELKSYQFNDFSPLLKSVASNLYMCFYILASRFE